MFQTGGQRRSTRSALVWSPAQTAGRQDQLDAWACMGSLIFAKLLPLQFFIEHKRIQENLAVA